MHVDNLIVFLTLRLGMVSSSTRAHTVHFYSWPGYLSFISLLIFLITQGNLDVRPSVMVLFHSLLNCRDPPVSELCGLKCACARSHPANGTHATICHHSQHFVINPSKAAGLRTLMTRPHWCHCVFVLSDIRASPGSVDTKVNVLICVVVALLPCVVLFLSARRHAGKRDFTAT